jgi:putative tryptophan/tyrosine transport system substrate-binding protein
MRRRDFIAGLGGAVAWPLAARAQQVSVPVVGFLAPGLPAKSAHLAGAFHQGLREAGFREGQNVHVEYRWAEDQYARLPALAADLARRQVRVIMALATPAAFAAKAATATIPVVFSASLDPVEYGLVASFSRPGGNVTGVSFLASQLAAKQLEAIHLLLPNASLIGLLVNPGNPAAEGDSVVCRTPRAGSIRLL